MKPFVNVKYMYALPVVTLDYLGMCFTLWLIKLAQIEVGLLWSENNEELKPK